MMPNSSSSSLSSAPHAKGEAPSLPIASFWLGNQLNLAWQQWVGTFATQPVGQFKLIACSHKLPPTWQMDAYLTYHHTINTPAIESLATVHPLCETALELRFSSHFQQQCLQDWLGKPSAKNLRLQPNQPLFNSATSLERFLLSQFAQNCFTALQEQWCSPALATHQHHAETGGTLELDETLVHMAWIYEPHQTEPAAASPDNEPKEYTPMVLDELPVSMPKVILSIPQYAIPTQNPAIPFFKANQEQATTIAQTIDYLQAQGITARSVATLSAGYTQLSTADLKALERDDLIVLEESNYHQLFLKHPALEVYLPFPISGLTHWPYQLPAQEVSPPPPFERGHPAMMSHPHMQQHQHHHHPIAPNPHTHSADWQPMPSQAQNSLWDSLKVDVHAEFAPAKIPVGHLKQMSEGLIVEVADLLKNQVQLVVNGSVLAHGQLVIVGDKFGVLLTKVVGKEEPSLPALGDGIPDQLALQSHAEQHSVGGSHEPHAHSANQPYQEPHNPYEGIDPNLVQAALQMGIDPFLAQTALQLGMDLDQIIQAAQQQGMEPNQFLTLVFQQQGIEVPTPQQRQQQSQFQGGGAGMNRQQGAEGEAPEEYVQEVSRANEMLSEVDSLLSEEYEDEEYEEEEET